MSLQNQQKQHKLYNNIIAIIKKYETRSKKKKKGDRVNTAQENEKFSQSRDQKSSSLLSALLARAEFDCLSDNNKIIKKAKEM